jgi:hypothetical protein
MKPKFHKAPHLSYSDSLAMLCLTSVMVFPQSFLFVKFFLLAAYTVFSLLQMILGKTVRLYTKLVIFYLVISGIGLIWSLVGMVNGGETAGIISNLRLYVLWSLAFCVFYHLLMCGNAFLVFHKSIVISGIIISLINIFAVINYVLEFWFIPISIIKDMDMFVGVHKGYIQITSINIGSLFFITTYLIAIQFQKKPRFLNNIKTKISLLLCLIVVVLSGRRALWIIVPMVPLFIVALTLITNTYNKTGARKRLLVIALCCFTSIMTVSYLVVNGKSNSIIKHVENAFSTSDARTSQSIELIDGFMKYPIFGSGFGVGVSTVRNKGAPWLFELTYHQKLFNFGVVGSVIFVFLLISYLKDNVVYISLGNNNSGIAFGLLLGLGAQFMAAYSNPYFGSFDFLLLLGILPLISSLLKTEYQTK